MEKICLQFSLSTKPRRFVDKTALPLPARYLVRPLDRLGDRVMTAHPDTV